MRRQTGLGSFLLRAGGFEAAAPFRVPSDPGADESGDPIFVSRTYGEPGYAELAPECAWEIRHGADDQEALGVYHDLYWSAREAGLREALGDYLPGRRQRRCDPC